jgi:hypothetical protein
MPRDYRRGTNSRPGGPDPLRLYQRCQEAVELLMEMDGHTEMTKGEFCEALAKRYGNVWRKIDGSLNKALLNDVMNLTRDQALDPTAAALLAGFVVAYSPNVGGITLLDPTGEMPLPHLLHMLSGDMQRQQAEKTVMRRRVPSWGAAAKSALAGGDHDLGLLLGQMQNEIASSGFVSDSLVAEYIKALRKRGIHAFDGTGAE